MANEHGGEWTALRELAERWINWPGDGVVVLERHDNGRELKATLEALAAAAPAPAPPPGPPRSLAASANWIENVYKPWFHKTSVAPPPQDGQGAELLGPPRGGSSSDLAEQLAQARAALSKLRMSHCDWAGYLVHKEDETHSILEYDEHCPKCVIDRILKEAQ